MNNEQLIIIDCSLLEGLAGYMRVTAGGLKGPRIAPNGDTDYGARNVSVARSRSKKRSIMMESEQSLGRKPKGHLRNESMLKALPPDILKELVRRRLEDIEKAKQNLPKKQ
jgi:hypothetical protein